MRELGAEPVPNSLKITYTVGGNNYLVHDDGRGNLIDDDGNGRGTVQGKTVLLTTAAIPDAASYIIYSFGVDLDTVKYGEQALAPAYHAAIIDDEVVGDITITWGENKTATMSDGVITGDASGTFEGKELHIAPNETVAKDTVFTVTYNKVLDSMTTAINASHSPQNSSGVFTGSVDVASAIEGVDLQVALSDRLRPQVMVVLSIADNNNSLFVKGVFYPSYQSAPQYAGNTVTIDTKLSWMPYASSSANDWTPVLVSSSVNKSTGKIDFTIKVTRKKKVTDVVMVGGINKKPVFSTSNVDESLFIETAQLTGIATLGASTESATFDMTADKLIVAPPVASDTPVVSGSVFVDALGYSLRDDNGRIKDGDDIVGNINIQSGVIELTTWRSGVQNTATLKSMLRENDPVPLANLIFRTPVAPLKKASLQISAEPVSYTHLTLPTICSV